MNNALRIFTLMLAVLSLVVGGGVVLGKPPATKSDDRASVATWPFFAFDNGVGRDKGWTPKQQAELTARLGFDGIGYTRVEDLENRFAACDANRQHIFSFYVAYAVGKDRPVTPKTLQSLPQLEGKNAILWISTHGKATEVEAVASFQQFADEVGKYGVKVAIYPHDSNYIETARHALRLAKAVDRKNFGISINVCHELKAGNGDDLVSLVKDSIDHIFLVSINGADHMEYPNREKGWHRLIKPLGEGDFDLLPLLRQLRSCGYQGPIGLQCYQIPGEIEDILEKSITVWHNIIAQLGKE